MKFRSGACTENPAVSQHRVAWKSCPRKWGKSTARTGKDVHDSACPGNRRECKHVFPGGIHHVAELWEPGAWRIGHRSPLRFGHFGGVLHKHHSAGHRDPAALGIAGERQGVNEVHAAPLPGGLEHLGYGRLDALVAIADRQPDSSPAASIQADIKPASREDT